MKYYPMTKKTILLKNNIDRIVPELHQTFIKLHKRNLQILKKVKTA